MGNGRQWWDQNFTPNWFKFEYLPWLFEQIDGFGETSDLINTRAFAGVVWETDFLG